MAEPQLKLYGHAFSSYTWKAKIALLEKGLPFTFCALGPDEPENGARLNALWPVGQFPVLEDGDATLIESSIIIEHLDIRFPDTPRLIPLDAAAALPVRFMDRVFDNHVMAPMQAVVAEHLPHLNAAPDPVRVERSIARLATIYAWLEGQLPDTAWGGGDDFSLVDCAAAPALFYADWVHPIPDDCPRLKAYRARLLGRASVAHCVEEARPYRSYFPLGAPDRD